MLICPPKANSVLSAMKPEKIEGLCKKNENPLPYSTEFVILPVWLKFFGWELAFFMEIYYGVIKTENQR
jgi:hypothetical protein